MTHLFDTDHISILQRRSGPEFLNVVSRRARHPSADLALSVVSFHEQILGCNAYISRARTSVDVVLGYDRLGRLLSDYSAVTVLPFDSAAATVLGGLLAQWVRVGTMDLRIASIALAHGLVLVTRNLRDFR